MSPEEFVNLLEEMIELKVQQHTDMRVKTSPELAKVLQQKREEDRQRLDQIKALLVELLGP